MTTPKKIELKEGEAYVRFEGITYRVKLDYFKLEAYADKKEIELEGTVLKG